MAKRRNGGNGKRRFLDWERDFTLRMRDVVYWGGWLVAALILAFFVLTQWHLRSTRADLARVQQDLEQANRVIEILGREADRREAELDSLHERLQHLEKLETSVRSRLDQVPAHLQPHVQTVAAQATATIASYRPVTDAGRAVAVERQLNALSAAVQSTPYLWPVPGGELTSGFGVRQNPMGGTDRQNHRGIDIAARRGTPALASAAGKVSYVGWGGAYGLVVVVGHAGGAETLYGHLDKARAIVGDWVDQGQILGHVGSTGRSTGPHLHFEVRKSGGCVDPCEWVGRGGI